MTCRRNATGLCFSPQKIVLEGIVERVDVLIDQVLEDGVQEEETHG
jgi:hypothetical protein